MADAPASRPNLYRRLTSSVPLAISILVHVVLVLGAGVWVVSENYIGKKKVLEAPPPIEDVAQKQVEHRLQVARRGGAASSASPVSAQRIFSTSESALQMPEMPELPQMKSGGTGGFGEIGGGLGQGIGNSTNTSLGSGGLGGRGFMSLSFLGLTNVRAQKVVFVVDTSRGTMDIKKEGFRAFGIIREQIIKLVSGLPPSAEFSVVLFEDTSRNINRYSDALVAATTENKTKFIEWMKPVNADSNRLGVGSSGPGGTRWRRSIPPNSGIEPEYQPSAWAQGFNAAIELKPDTIFVVTGGSGAGMMQLSEKEIEDRKKEREEQMAEMQRAGLDWNAVNAARQAEIRRVSDIVAALNKTLVEQKKDPFVYRTAQRLFEGDFIAAVKRAGGNYTPNYDGWKDKAGRPIWRGFYRVAESARASEQDLIEFIARLQAHFLKESATVNIFYFAGPDDKAEGPLAELGKIARKYNGRVERITAKRLDDLNGRTP